MYVGVRVYVCMCVSMRVCACNVVSELPTAALGRVSKEGKGRGMSEDRGYDGVAARALEGLEQDVLAGQMEREGELVVLSICTRAYTGVLTSHLVKPASSRSTGQPTWLTTMYRQRRG